MSNYQPQNIILNNFNARFIHVPNKNKPVMIFLPGNLQEITSLNTLSCEFAKDFDFYAIELPGSGNTDPLESYHNINFLADCLNQFVETVIKAPFHLVACSYGTSIGVEYAKNYANNILKLVLAGCMQEIPERFRRTFLHLMSLCLSDPKGFAESYFHMLTTDHPHIPRREAVMRATMRKARAHTDRQYQCFIYNTIRLLAYRAQNLNQISCPTLCFTGQYDPFVTPESCRDMAKLIPGASFDVLENTDHLFYMQKPMETVALIRSFLQVSKHEEVEHRIAA